MIKPINDNVIIKQIYKENITDSGIVISEENSNNTKMGEIISLSESSKKLFRIGQKVFLNNMGYKTIQHDDQTFEVYPIDNILGIWEDEEDEN